MELTANTRMVHLPIVIIWLATLVLSVVSHTYRFPQDVEVDEEVYDTERPVYQDENWIESFLHSPDSQLSESRRSADVPTELRGHKRISYGFSGLDLLDHIMTTLDKTPKPTQQNEHSKDRDIYNLMKING